MCDLNSKQCPDNKNTYEIEFSEFTEEDKQFSTSHWSKRGPPREMIPMHIKFIEKECNMVRKLIPCHLNIKYGDTTKEKFDIYGTDLEDDAPIYIHIHGGFWQALGKDLSCYMVKPLYDNNYKVIIIGYELCPNITVPQIMTQIEEAFKGIMDYANKLGTKAIYLGGHSAGAQLVSSLYHRVISSLPSNQRAIVKEVFLISGIYDLIPLVTTYINKKLQLDVATARKCSPIFMEINDYAKEDTIFYIFVGRNDPPKFIEQSKEYYEKLRKIGVKVQLRILDECDHFNIMENMIDEEFEVVKMIVKTREL